MKKIFLFALPVLSIALLSGCHSLAKKYDANASAGQSWLAENKTDRARTDFEGVYYSPEWGPVVLKQDQGQITGSIGAYHIKGIASGRDASLLLIDDDWIEYTMKVHRKNYEILEGEYSPSIPFQEGDSNGVRLYRIVE